MEIISMPFCSLLVVFHPKILPNKLNLSWTRLFENMSLAPLTSASENMSLMTLISKNMSLATLTSENRSLHVAPDFPKCTNCNALKNKFSQIMPQTPFQIFSNCKSWLLPFHIIAVQEPSSKHLSICMTTRLQNSWATAASYFTSCCNLIQQLCTVWTGCKITVSCNCLNRILCVVMIWGAITGLCGRVVLCGCVVMVIWHKITCPTLL